MLQVMHANDAIYLGQRKH